METSASVIGFAVSLCDVAPDGTSALVAKGMRNATRRASLSEPAADRARRAVRPPDRDRRHGLDLRARPPHPPGGGERRLPERLADARDGHRAASTVAARPASSCRSFRSRAPWSRRRSRRRPSPSARKSSLHPRPSFRAVRDALTGHARFELDYAQPRGDLSEAWHFSAAAEVDPRDPASASVRGTCRVERRYGALTVGRARASHRAGQRERFPRRRSTWRRSSTATPTSHAAGSRPSRARCCDDDAHRPDHRRGLERTSPRLCASRARMGSRRSPIRAVSEPGHPRARRGCDRCPRRLRVRELGAPVASLLSPLFKAYLPGRSGPPARRSEHPAVLRRRLRAPRRARSACHRSRPGSAPTACACSRSCASPERTAGSRRKRPRPAGGLEESQTRPVRGRERGLVLRRLRRGARALRARDRVCERSSTLPTTGTCAASRWHRASVRRSSSGWPTCT